MRNIFYLCALSLLWASQTLAMKAVEYKIDTSHFNVGFKVRHLVIATVTGRFDKFEGAFKFDPKSGKLTSVEAKIDIDSINTNEADRDKHLKGKDFFGVRSKDGKINEKNRFIVFKSSKVVNRNKKPIKVHGTLSINGKTKKVVLDVEYKGAVTDPWGNKKVVFAASTKVKRKDFGLTWNKKLDGGGFVIGDEVTVTLEGEANAVDKGKG